MNQKQQRVINPIPNMPSNSNGLKIYQTGLYVRLSVEDGGLSKESESIVLIRRVCERTKLRR